LRAVSPVVAVILVLGVAITSVAIAYMWYSTAQSEMQEKAASRKEQLKSETRAAMVIDRVMIKPTAGGLQVYVYVRNTGDVRLNQIHIYLTVLGEVVAEADTLTAVWAATEPPSVRWGSSYLDPREAGYTVLSTPLYPPGTVLTVTAGSAEGASATASKVLGG